MSISKLQDEIIKLNPLQASFIQASIEGLTQEENDTFCNYLNYCSKIGISLIFLAQSYDLIVKDTFKEQIYFKRNKKYRFSKYSEVADSVYNSKQYMQKYMYGLAISAFLWPNHRAMHRYFLDVLPTNITGKYLEIGPGHGFYFVQSMKRTNFSHYTGVDISPISVALTKSILKENATESYDNYEIIQSDFFSWSNENKFDFVVMAEVLEHVEQPQQFLNKIHNILTTGGEAFITTCINAPAIDHIYLYQCVDSLLSQIKESNFSITSQLVVPYDNLTLEQTMALSLPVNIALLIKKI